MADVHDKILTSPSCLNDFPTRSTGKHTKQKKKKVASTTTSNKKQSRETTTDTGGDQSVET
jgi:hypothetical protein